MKDTVLHSHLDRIHPFQTHLTTSFTVYVLPDMVWLHHYHPSSLCLGPPCSSLLTSTWAAVLHWKWLSFLPLSGEHLHSLLFDKTHAPGNQCPGAAPCHSVLHKFYFPVYFALPELLQEEMEISSFSSLSLSHSSVLLNSSCPGRAKG